MYKLKQTPEDFIVDEVSKLSLIPQGEFIIFKVKKVGWNTVSVIQKIAEYLNVKVKEINYAGLKDRNAITTQYCSILNSNRNKEKLEKFKLGDVELEIIGFSNEKLFLGNLQGNNFVINVRSLEKDNYIVNKPKKIINYFDEQRFSLNNVEIGKCLLLKDFKRATELMDNYKLKESIKNNPTDLIGAINKVPRRILTIYVHAYQSYLWNEVVAKLLRQELGLENCYSVKYSCGEFVYPRIGLSEEFANLKIPLFGFMTNMNDLDSRVRKVLIDVLKEEKMTVKNFIVKQIPFLSLEGNERFLSVKISDLNVASIEKDELNENKEKLKVSFFLLKSSYATQAIRQIILEK